MNVVLYERYSSNSQSEQSIEGQDTVNRAYCEKYGYNIIETYVDRATSAKTDNRPEFLRMIDDSKKGKFEVIIVYKLDRFARNRYDSAIYKARLKKNGVKVISATEPISDSPEGILLESVLEGMAEFYSAELSQKISRGINESAKKLQHIGGRPPLGYKIENKRLVIDEATAPIVREAYEMYAEGHTIKDICDVFNERGYKTSYGKEFNKNSFRRMFMSERYIGVYDSNGVRVEGGIPRIIDDELFHFVNDKMKNRQRVKGSTSDKDQYILTGKLFCGLCDEMLIGDSAYNKKKKMHRYYTCVGKKRLKTCEMHSIPKQFIEDLVVEETMKMLSDDVIEEIAKVAVEKNREDIAEHDRTVELSAMLNGIEVKINNLVTAIEDGLYTKALASKLEALEKQRVRVEKELKDAKADVFLLEEDHVIYWLSLFKNGDVSDPEFRRKLVDCLVNKVVVYPDRLLFSWNIIRNNAQVQTCSDIDTSSPREGFHPNTFTYNKWLLI